MNITDKLITIAENEQKVYDAGYEKGKAESGDNWSALNVFVADRKDYSYAFSYWKNEYFTLNEKIQPTNAPTRGTKLVTPMSTLINVM